MNPAKIITSKPKTYSPSALTNAYLAVKDDGMTVKRAAIEFSVPTRTLRDRVLGKVDIDTFAVGRAPLFSLEEEARMANHFKEMAKYGYGYSCREVLDIATDFAVQLGKRTKNQVLTEKWFRQFMKRWPDLSVVRSRALEAVRARAASMENVNAYFQELDSILTKYNLKERPHLIYNVDEKGITLNHTPPHVVAEINSCPPAVTSGKSSTITILGCGSASGVAVPPYFVFPGVRMRSELLEGATPGANGDVSESGWSNSGIFKQYLESHFLRYAPGRCEEPILLLLDGHKTHVSLGVIEWAKSNNITLHILPAHTSHILQPLDVACYGPFQRMYNAECHKKIRANSSVITKHNVCEIACRVYSRALSAEKLQSAFKQTGIYPLNRNIIPNVALLPAEVFEQSSSDITRGALNQPDQDTEMSPLGEVAAEKEIDMFQSKVDNLKKVKSEITKKPRNTVGKIVSGKPITEEDVAEKVKEHMNRYSSKKVTKEKTKKIGKEIQKEKAKITAKGKTKTCTYGKKRLQKQGIEMNHHNQDLDLTT